MIGLSATQTPLFPAGMTRAAFTRLSYEHQLAAVFDEGTFLAQRREGTDSISLYYLNSFFVELYYDTQVQALACVRNFSNSLPLAAYVDSMQLPGLQQE